MPSFFTTKFSLWVIGILAFMLVASNTVQEIRLSDLRSTLKTAQNDLVTCTTNLGTSQANEAVLSASIDAQNAKIKAMQAEAARQAAEAKAASDAALEQAKKRKAEAAAMGSGPDVMNAWQKGLFQ